MADATLEAAAALYDRIALKAMNTAAEHAAKKANDYLAKLADGETPKIAIKLNARVINLQDFQRRRGITQIARAEKLATSTSLIETLAPKELSIVPLQTDLVDVQPGVAISIPAVETNDPGTWNPTKQQTETMWAIFAKEYFTKFFALIGKGLA